MKAKEKKLDRKRGFLSAFVDSNIYVILAFLCASVLMLLVYYCFDVIPFGGRTVLRMDLYHQYGPLFAELYDRLTDLKSLVYSWNTGAGGSFLGNYYNYLSSPIGAIITLLAGHGNVPEAIGVMVLVKNALAASTLALYLKKSTGKNDFSISAFGLLYAFCGYFIAYYWNIMWIDAMYLLPLIVLGIENIINKRKCKLYVLSLAIAFFSNYYMAYMLCIFAVIYFLVYYFGKFGFKSNYDDIPTKLDEEGKEYSTTGNKVLYNRFLRSGALFGGSSLIAALLVAFALIPTYFCLKECSATSGTFPEEYKLYNSVFDFLANHIGSLEPTIRSSGDTVLPNVYCGVLTILLVPLYITCSKISIKERAANIIMLALFFVGFNLNYANYILHAMHFPNDLPFRFSFIYSFVLISLAFKTLMHIRDISGKAILASGIGVMLFAVMVEKIGMDNASDMSIYLTIGFTVVYVAVLALMKNKSYAQSAVSLLLMCCVFAEVAIGDTDRFSITQEKVNFTNDYADFRALKDELDEQEGNDKYRMELTKINTLMDASWFNYNGVSTFSSMAYEKVANLQSKLGLDSNYINSYTYNPQTPVYNMMMSLKYIVKNDNYNVNKDLLTFSMRCGKYNAYENNYYLPIAYCVDRSMADLSIDSDNPFDIQSDYWYRATGMSNIFTPIAATGYELDNVTGNEDDLLTESFSITKSVADADGEVTLKFDIEESQNVYLYFDSNEIEEIEVYTESTSFAKTQSIDESYVLDCGYCEAGDTLIVKGLLPADNDSAHVNCYTVGLDNQILDIGHEILTQGAIEIDTFDETYIKGTINAGEDKMVYTSINYDDGWTVLVDGKEVEKIKIADALVGFNIDEGEHTVEFRFKAQGLAIGGIISTLTAVGLIIFLIIRRRLNGEPILPIKLKRTQKNNKPKAKVREILEESEPQLPPKGIDAMMAEDLGPNATVEQAEALLNPDEYEGQLERNAPTLSRANELLNTQKLDLTAILSAVEDNDEEDKQ